VVVALAALLEAIVLGAMGVSEPSQVVALWRRSPSFQSRVLASRWEYSQWRARNRSFSGVAAARLCAFDLETDQGTERIRGAEVSANLFELLGVRPKVGHLFSSEPEQRDEHWVVLGDGFWKRRYGADPGIVGRHIRLSDGRSALFRVAGVIETLPLLRSDTVPEDVFTVLSDPRDLVVSRSDSSYWVYARLRPGVSTHLATEDMERLTAELAAEANDGWSFRVVVSGLREAILVPVRPVLVVLQVIALLMTLAGCAFVANLRLVLLTAYGQEIATRFALGATPWQVGRRLALEGIGLVACGALLGFALGIAGVRIISHFMPAPLLWLHQLQPVSPLAVGVAAGGMAAFALSVTVPAFYVALRTARRAAPAKAGARRVRDALLSAQLAVTLALLSWALAMTGSVWRLWRVDAGFSPAGVVVAETYRPLAKTQGWDEDVPGQLDAIRQIPGLLEAAHAEDIPYSPNRSLSQFQIVGEREKRESFVSVVGSGYFGVLRIPLVAGRVFTSHDEGRAGSAVVSMAAADRWFGGKRAIGSLFKWGGETYSVVGIVGDVKEVGTIRDGVRVTGLEEVEVPYVYLSGPRPQQAWRSYYLIRSVAGDLATVALLRGRLAAGEVSAIRVYPLLDRIQAARSDSATYAAIFGMIAILAAALAASAVYSLARTSISSRVQEVAIRAALGASPAVICWTFQRELLRISATSVLLGTAAGFWGESTLAHLLFGANGSGVEVIGLATLALIAVIAASSWAAIWRQSHVSPAALLRWNER